MLLDQTFIIIKKALIFIIINLKNPIKDAYNMMILSIILIKLSIPMEKHNQTIL